MKNKIDFKDWVSWIIAAIGVFAAVVSAFVAKSPGFFTAFVSLLVTEGLLLFIWIYHLKEQKKADQEYSILQRDLESKSREIESLEKDIISTKGNFNTLLGTLAVNMKNTSKLNNEFLIKLPALSEESYHTIDILQTSENVDETLIKTELIRSFEEYANGLYELYKRYTVNLLACTVKIEESYLTYRNFNFKVSATIKLFDKPLASDNTDRNNIKVYSAFRDKSTYDSHEREIGENLYSIDGNVDFVHCLRKDQYIINNAYKGCESYLNEHIDFDMYYNCAVVVPLRCKQSDGTQLYYGYLCCDCLNKQFKNEEIFDVKSAQFLFSLAQQYATFLEALDSNWNERTQIINVDEKSFLEMIFKKTYTGRPATNSLDLEVII